MFGKGNNMKRYITIPFTGKRLIFVDGTYIGWYRYR